MFTTKTYFFKFLTFSLFVLIEGQNYPACVTPANENGKCVPLKSCKNIWNTFTSGRQIPPKILNYIRKSVCSFPGSSGHHVCCQLVEIDYSTTVTSQPTVVTTPTTVIGAIQHRNLNLFDFKSCGQLSQERISNGNKTYVFQYPWMAMLRYESNDRKKLENKCGGSLINTRYVLTAAHCVKDRAANLVQVRLGEHNLDTEIDCNLVSGERDCAPPVQDIPIESILPHPSYNKPRYSNDIALVRLSVPANTHQDHIQPICLPVTVTLRNLVLENYVIAGWGLTEDGTKSNELLQAIIPNVKLSDCTRELQSKSYKVALTESQMCAGGKNMIDSCRGDSGGPLMFPVDFDGSKFVQFGIVSAGVDACGTQDIPGIYVRVGGYLEWILDNIRS